VRALGARLRCDCAVTSAVHRGVSEHRGIPTVLKTRPVKPNWTELNWQPSGSIPVSATNSLYTYGLCAAICSGPVKFTVDLPLGCLASFAIEIRPKAWLLHRLDRVSRVSKHRKSYPRRSVRRASIRLYFHSTCQQMRNMSVSQSVKLTPLGSFKRRQSADTDDEIESGLSGVPSDRRISSPSQFELNACRVHSESL